MEFSTWCACPGWKVTSRTFPSKLQQKTHLVIFSSYLESPTHPTPQSNQNDISDIFCWEESLILRRKSPTDFAATWWSHFKKVSLKTTKVWPILLPRDGAASTLSLSTIFRITLRQKKTRDTSTYAYTTTKNIARVQYKTLILIFLSSRLDDLIKCLKDLKSQKLLCVSKF